MSKRDWKFLFEDILECTVKIDEYLNDLDYTDFVKNSMLIDAIVRNIEIIGEASARVPDTVQNKFSDIPWKQLRGIRNRIIHEYFGVDLNIIWHIVKNDIPLLKKQVNKALESN